MPEPDACALAILDVISFGLAVAWEDGPTR